MEAYLSLDEKQINVALVVGAVALSAAALGFVANLVMNDKQKAGVRELTETVKEYCGPAIAEITKEAIRNGKY